MLTFKKLSFVCLQKYLYLHIVHKHHGHMTIYVCSCAVINFKVIICDNDNVLVRVFQLIVFI